MIRLAVFDCDGTLADGQAEVIAAMAEAFAALHLPAPSPDNVRRIVGLSLPAAMRMLLPAAETPVHDALAEEYRAAYRRARADGRLREPLFPGIAALLATLAARGWILGVATGKSDRGLAHTLAAHGIARHFTTLQTADRHPSKPHPAMLAAAIAEAEAAPADTVMIGDTAYDMAMAHAAGARAIGVGWGYHPAAELSAAGAEAVAQDTDELAELLR